MKSCVITLTLFLSLFGLFNSAQVQSSFISYSIGAGFSCFINLKGSMKCFGRNDSGQLGLGDKNDRGNDVGEMGLGLPFVNLGTGLTVKVVECGYYHGCAMLSNNGTKCWGLNSEGQLGVLQSKSVVGDEPGEMGDALPFVQLGFGIVPTQFAIGKYFSCALFDNKMVKCWGIYFHDLDGYEDPESIGNTNPVINVNLPYIDLGVGVLVDSIHSFGYALHVCVVLTTQKLKCWGANNVAQLGYGDKVDRGSSVTMGDNLLEVNLGIESRVKQVSVGAYFTCALIINDDLKCWGKNTEGQLGIGNTDSPIKLMGTSLLSTKVDNTGKRAAMISAGFFHTCFVLPDMQSVKCVGDGWRGVLGNGDTYNRGNEVYNTADKNAPIYLGTSLLIKSIHAAFEHTCVVFADHSLKCFGNAEGGVLGYESETNIGTSPAQMGTSLPFVNVFPATQAPTASPTNPCSYTDVKSCKSDNKCVFDKKTKTCNLIDCTKLSESKCKKAIPLCAYNKETKTCFRA